MIRDLLTADWRAFYLIAHGRAIRCSCGELRRLARAAREWAAWCERLAAAGEPKGD